MYINIIVRCVHYIHDFVISSLTLYHKGRIHITGQITDNYGHGQ